MSILAIDLGGTTIKIGRVDDGTIRSKQKVPVNPEHSFSQHLEKLIPMLRDLRQQSYGSGDDPRGIGLSFPGLVDRESTSVHSTNAKFNGAREFDLESWADEQFQLPIMIENDVRTALLGEWKYGAGQGVKNLVMVTVGTGFGSSVLLQDKLLTGTHQQAGVLGGHITVRMDGYECTCGNRGCVETETGEWNLPRIIRDHELYEESALADADSLNYRTLLEAADDDSIAEEILERRLSFLGRGIVNLIHAYDPERVVIGGGPMNRAEDVLPVIWNEIAEHAWTPWGTVDLQPAANPDYAALLGLEVLFEHDCQTL